MEEFSGGRSDEAEFRRKIKVITDPGEKGDDGKEWEQDMLPLHFPILPNANITLRDIPLEAYDYIVNGKPAIEWIMERYRFNRNNESQITNDANDWSEDSYYIINLLKRVVRVSLETMKIVRALPQINEL